MYVGMGGHGCNLKGKCLALVYITELNFGMLLAL